MPVYVYECPRCRLRFELRQGYDEEPRTKCPDPDCKGIVYRVIQPVSFIMKREGFQREKQEDGSSIWSKE